MGVSELSGSCQKRRIVLKKLAKKEGRGGLPSD